MTLYGTIQVDVDGLSVIRRYCGLPERVGADTVFVQGVTRFLELFDRYGVKATWFVVGQDLQDPVKAGLLRQVLAAGHELANHSWDHPVGLSFLSSEELRRQVADMRKLCEQELHYRPVGFKAPDFDMHEGVLQVLEELGYEYDCSVLPCFWSGVLRFFRRRMTKIGVVKNRYLGESRYGLAPRHPYHPNLQCLWKRGQAHITEFPVSTSYWLGLPLHASFVFLAETYGWGRRWLAGSLKPLVAHQVPLNFLFHPCELADPVDEPPLRKHPSLGCSWPRKLVLVEDILKTLKQHYELLPTRELTRRTP